MVLLFEMFDVFLIVIVLCMSVIGDLCFVKFNVCCDVDDIVDVLCVLLIVFVVLMYVSVSV